MLPAAGGLLKGVACTAGMCGVVPAVAGAPVFCNSQSERLTYVPPLLLEAYLLCGPKVRGGRSSSLSSSLFVMSPPRGALPVLSCPVLSFPVLCRARQPSGAHPTTWLFTFNTGPRPVTVFVALDSRVAERATLPLWMREYNMSPERAVVLTTDTGAVDSYLAVFSMRLPAHATDRAMGCPEHLDMAFHPPLVFVAPSVPKNPEAPAPAPPKVTRHGTAECTSIDAAFDRQAWLHGRATHRHHTGSTRCDSSGPTEHSSNSNSATPSPPPQWQSVDTHTPTTVPARSTSAPVRFVRGGAHTVGCGLPPRPVRRSSSVVPAPPTPHMIRRASASGTNNEPPPGPVRRASSSVTDTPMAAVIAAPVPGTRETLDPGTGLGATGAGDGAVQDPHPVRTAVSSIAEAGRYAFAAGMGALANPTAWWS